METSTPRKSRTTLILGILTLAAAGLLIMLMVRCLPYFEGLPWTLAAQTEAPTELPTQKPTEPTAPPTQPPPTEPPPDPNPYGKLDFQYENNYLKCQAGDSRTGIDVSAHQQEIDWKKVKASGVEFAMIRVGYRGYESGKITADKYAKANLKGALDAGLEVGVYFFSQALDVEEAKEEAAFVLEAIEDYEITMPVVYDWEAVKKDGSRTQKMDARTLTDCSLAFLKAVEDAGYWPMLYFNTHQSRTLLHLSELKQYDFWLARYSDRMTYPYKLKMWQYTNTGRVPGIAGNTDINVFFVDT